MKDQTDEFQTVRDCYDVLALARPAGTVDFTEGIYHDDRNTSYEKAQANQRNYLLEQARFAPGMTILDIGSGYGTLLEEINRRGGHGVGITIAPEQASNCRKRGLDVHLLNYRDIPKEWNGRFDAVIANGSLEHFVQPETASMADQIYKEMFETIRRIINPSSASRRFVTTAIHFKTVPRPFDVIVGPFAHKRNSDKFHYAMVLGNCFGCWYPSLKQLANCTQGLFTLEAEVDGTTDYHWTSEEWLHQLKVDYISPKFWAHLFRKFVTSPKHTYNMMYCGLKSQSWNWQFRGENPPTRLLRQTWTYV